MEKNPTKFQLKKGLNMTMEQALKEVFYVHRNIVRELNHQLELHKVSLDSEHHLSVKLLQKIELLQKNIDSLKAENQKLLQTIHDLKTNCDNSLDEVTADGDGREKTAKLSLSRRQSKRSRYVEEVEKRCTSSREPISPALKKQCIRQNEVTSQVDPPTGTNQCSETHTKQCIRKTNGTSQVDQPTVTNQCSETHTKQCIRKTNGTSQVDQPTITNQCSETHTKHGHGKHSHINSKSQSSHTDMYQKDPKALKSCDSVILIDTDVCEKRRQNSGNQSTIFRKFDRVHQDDSEIVLVPETELVIVPETLGMGETSDEDEDTQATVKAAGVDQSIKDVLVSPRSNTDESCQSPVDGRPVVSSLSVDISGDLTNTEFSDCFIDVGLKAPEQERNELSGKESCAAKTKRRKEMMKRFIGECDIPTKYLSRQRTETASQLPGKCRISKMEKGGKEVETISVSEMIVSPKINQSFSQSVKRNKSAMTMNGESEDEGRQLILVSDLRNVTSSKKTESSEKCTGVKRTCNYDQKEKRRQNLDGFPSLSTSVKSPPKSPIIFEDAYDDIVFPMLVQLSKKRNESTPDKTYQSNQSSSFTAIAKQCNEAKTTSIKENSNSSRPDTGSETSSIERDNVENENLRGDSKHQGVEVISRPALKSVLQLRQRTLIESFVLKPASTRLSSPLKRDEQAGTEKEILSLFKVPECLVKCKSTNKNEIVQKLGCESVVGHKGAKTCTNTDHCISPCTGAKRCTSPCTGAKRCTSPCTGAKRCTSTDHCVSPCKGAKRCTSPCTGAKPCGVAVGNVNDLDETLPPDNVYTPGCSQVGRSLHNVTQLLNGSLDPDCTLTELCEGELEPKKDRKITDKNNCVGKISNSEKLKKCQTDDMHKGEHCEILKQYPSADMNRSEEKDVYGMKKKGDSEKQTDDDEMKEKWKKKSEDNEGMKKTLKKETKNKLDADGVMKGDKLEAVGVKEKGKDESDGDNHQTTLAEESQNVPSSSTSFKFGCAKQNRLKRTPPTVHDQSQVLTQTADSDSDCDSDAEIILVTSLGAVERSRSPNDSFDRVPKKKEDDFAYADVVRGKHERKKLQGTTCKECYEYYKSAGMSDEEISKRVKECSRHRARYLAPSTPEHFWSIGFPDTQECHERGYIRDETPCRAKPSGCHRRRQKYKKLFKSKNEENSQDEYLSDSL